MEVNRNQIGDKLGEIVPFNYKPDVFSEYPYSFIVYMGEFPVRIKSRISESEFEKACWY